MTQALYMTIVEDLKNKILTGSIKPGDMLKSESEMMKEYSVSRMTLRKSLSFLSNAGYIYSVPGKGYFVRTPESDLYQFRFHDHESLDCVVDNIKLLSVKVEDVQGEGQELLGAPKNRRIIVLERMSFCDNIPVAVEFVYFPYEKNKPVVEDKLNFANYPKALETHLAFAIKRELEIRLTGAPEQVAERLLCRTGEPVFLITKKVLKKGTREIISASKFYIKKEYYTIKAVTPEEDDSKKVF